MRVVLVDGHTMERQGVRELLKSLGMTVVGDLAPHEEVVEEAGALAPEVLLLDPSMSGPDGLDLLRRWKRRYPNIPVIVLSMEADSLMGQAMDAGADGYVCKSSHPDELLQALAALARDEKPFCLGTRKAGRKAETGSLPLPRREREVLSQVGQGATLSDLASHFVVSRNTAKSHLHSLYRKLEVSDRAQLIVKASGLGLLPKVHPNG